MQNNTQREISYIEAIREAFELCLESDENVIIIGEGVPDPKAIFNSTKGLQEKFGSNRIFDMPLAENGVTGICIGAALTGMRPVMIHQRIDFALLSLDQIINNAAKWRFMFNNQSTVPIVIRMIVGRGWGQGPQHSQSLQALFAHIPGLKVVMPATPSDAKGMMISAIRDPDPVVFIEHRWLHNIKSYVPNGHYQTSLAKAQIVREGSLITVACISYMLIEGIIAADVIKEVLGVEVEIIDVRSVKPLDVETICASVRKTKHLLVLDTAHLTGGVSGELISSVIEKEFFNLKVAPSRICSPDYPAPTAPQLCSSYYPTPLKIVNEILRQCDLEVSEKKLEIIKEKCSFNKPHDVPYSDFAGPF